LSNLAAAGKAFLTAAPDDAMLKTLTASLIAQSNGAL
jgi:hypothetical protein